MLIKFLSITTLVLAFSSPLQVLAESSRATIDVVHTGDDTVGQRFAFAVREAIRGSQGYQLESGPKATYRIHLVTIDPEKSPSAQGAWAVVGVTYTMRNRAGFNERNPHTWYPIFLSSSVMVVGAKRADESAKSVLAALDSQIEVYLADLRESRQSK